MRHVRLTSQNIKKLSFFKTQISDILKELNKFDENDKSEAVSYIQTYINEDANNPGPSEHSETVTVALQKRGTIEEKSNQWNKIQKRKYNLRCSTKKKIANISNKNAILLKKIIYKCKVCNTSEKTKKNMLKHLQTHVGSPLSCIKCKKTFNGSVPFKWHLTYCNVACNKKWKFKCHLCTREFVTKRTLTSHLQGHKRNNCAYCDKVLTRRVHLVRHLLEVHSIKLERDTYKCDFCEKKYIKKCSLYYHLRQHLPDKIVCLECGKASDCMEEYEEHKRLHDLQKHFKCTKCGDKFSRRQQYLYHLKRHNQYRCITCDESYASRSKAVKHKQLGHDVEGLNPRFICPYCSVAFHRESRFHVHMRKHTEDNRSVNCKYCKKTFNSPYAYYKHCITINHEKFSPELTDIVCEKCGKHFAKRYEIKQHMYRVHNVSKQIVSCQYCDYKTVHKCNMDRHVALHFRENCQYTCEYCGKTCDSIPNLKDHIMYNHKQTKQFKCDKCEKAFKRNSELVRHQDSHSDERPHICTVCAKTYKRLNHLKRHESHAHQIVKESRRIKKIVTEEKSKEPKIVIVQQIMESDLQQSVLLNFANTNEISDVNMADNFMCFLPSEDLYKVYTDVSSSLCETQGSGSLENGINNG